jgi:hypothetical protein
MASLPDGQRVLPNNTHKHNCAVFQNDIESQSQPLLSLAIMYSL